MDGIKLVKKLGEGSYAVVYEAVDAAGNRLAVKELKEAPSR